MLRHLRVTNFAILSDVEIELGPGMNVLTGENEWPHWASTVINTPRSW